MRKKLISIMLAATMVFSVTACGKNTTGNTAGTQNTGVTDQDQTGLAQDDRALQIPDDKYHTYYELFVDSFYDSD